ncbi:Pyruvate kinase [Phycisphaerae bacterium RAS1]|nr:Pyruvate kinase [Phycisphaerae bacterium RAS1]
MQSAEPMDPSVLSGPSQPVQPLFRELRALYARARAAADVLAAADYANPDARASAVNFAAYVGIRGADIRDLQRDLHRLGLSSLGRIETHALDSLQRVCTLLAQLAGQEDGARDARAIGYDEGEAVLARRTTELLGPCPPRRTPRIMVTMPSEAAERYDLVRDLLAAGAQVVRINCAHDGPDHWAAMAHYSRRAAEQLGRPCTILCDLPGPKLRTSSIEPGPGVVRWHAFRDGLGEVTAPARVWISAGSPPAGPAHAVLPVNTAFVEQLRVGDEIHFRDHQGRKRWIVVVSVAPGGAWADAARGAFMVSGIPLTLRRGEQDLPVGGRVGHTPSSPREIELRAGDMLCLTRGDLLGHPARRGVGGEVIAPAQIGCSATEVLRCARPGERVFLDDGKIAAVIEETLPDRLRLRITWTRSNPSRLAGEKGINLPDTRLDVPSLTAADLGALDFIAERQEQIQALGLSFVRDASDVRALYHELDTRRLNLGVILKIETATAFTNLPAIVLSALRRNRVGVMIARGDLGVEVGFERMAELQEEIASLCAAAHLPVVWATQVLETLAKKGMPSRAEVSDVVLGARTQCVMLNKGPHLVSAVRFLGDVLERMEGHQSMHFRLMRALRVAQTRL